MLPKVGNIHSRGVITSRRWGIGNSHGQLPVGDPVMDWDTCVDCLFFRHRDPACANMTEPDLPRNARPIIPLVSSDRQGDYVAWFVRGRRKRKWWW
jgi:hypothetical protein